jgi:hypothetical protein
VRPKFCDVVGMNIAIRGAVVAGADGGVDRVQLGATMTCEASRRAREPLPTARAPYLLAIPRQRPTLRACCCASAAVIKTRWLLSCLVATTAAVAHVNDRGIDYQRYKDRYGQFVLRC